MEDAEIDSDNIGGPQRPRVRAILITILFPFIMGGLLGSIVHYNTLTKLLENPAGLIVLLGISTGATLLIWLAGFYQASTKGRAFGMNKKIWSSFILGGHLIGIVSGYYFV